MKSPLPVVLLGLLLAGCGGIALRELPAEPIAFVHRSSEDGIERAELLEKDEEKERFERQRQARGESVLVLEDAMDWLSGNTPGRSLEKTFGRLSLLDPRSLEVTRLKVARPGSRPVEWSSDHRYLRFAMPFRGAPQLFEFDGELREVRQVTHGPVPHPSGSISAAGRVAFTSIERKGGKVAARVGVTEEGGRAAQPLTEGPTDFDPVWSPTGEFVVFGSVLDKQPVIMRQDTEGERQLVTRGRHPDFTPDGEWLVFSARSRGRWRLFRIRPDGGGRTPVGSGRVDRFDELHPTVSPDGRYVVYVSQEAGRERLRIRRMDGTGDRPLLEAGDGTLPVW